MVTIERPEREDKDYKIYTWNTMAFRIKTWIFGADLELSISFFYCMIFNRKSLTCQRPEPP